MRIKFGFSLPRRKLVLPVNYNHALQSFIYHGLSASLAEFLHNRGFTYENRQFRLFTFSRIEGVYRPVSAPGRGGCLEFGVEISFQLSSPHDQILLEFANRLVTGVELSLERQPLRLESIVAIPAPEFGDEAESVRMLSPMTARRTVEVGEEAGGGRTVYYSPVEAEFSRAVRANLLKKYMAFYGRPPEDENFGVRPLFFSNNRNFHVIMYKGYVVKAYSGVFLLTGPGELKRFAWDCGLGERNSQGFGMFESWKQRGDEDS